MQILLSQVKPEHGIKNKTSLMNLTSHHSLHQSTPMTKSPHNINAPPPSPLNYTVLPSQGPQSHSLSITGTPYSHSPSISDPLQPPLHIYSTHSQPYLLAHAVQQRPDCAAGLPEVNFHPLLNV